MSYYDRSSATHLDGSQVFQTKADRDNEASVAALVEERWHCRVRSFGALAPIDWFASRQDRLVGLLELKSRTHASDRFPTVFLNARKWLALTLGSLGLGCPAIFVVRFEDGVRWISLSQVDAGSNRVAGCSRLVKSVNDIEPVIEIPISQMSALS